MKNQIHALLIFVWLWLLLLGQASGRPNILFILSDDHSFHDVGVYGNDEVGTPHLDALAGSGALFTHAYNMGSWSPAVCMPSRTMLQSGLFLWQAQARDAEAWMKEGRYWPQLIGAAGYRTYMTGKWHVPGVAPEDLYDVVRNVRPGMPNDTPDGYQRPAWPGQSDPWSPSDPAFEGFWRGGKHWSEVVVDDFELMLEDALAHEEPFFMQLCFNAPHDPRQAPAEFVAMYPQESVRVPDNYLPEYPYNEAIGSGRRLRDERLAPFPRTPYATRVQRQEYYAIITHMDVQIGRILRALEASGQRENTWIIYTSDHGLAVGQHGLMGKQNMYDHSLRVPFIVAGPGIPSGLRIQAPIYLQDVFPTAVELTGLPVPDWVQFRSLLPLLRGERQDSYPAIYGAYLDRQRAVVRDGYKLILYPQIQKLRLFHLETDPREGIDLAEGEADVRPLVKDLLRSMEELQQETGDRLDLRQAFGDWF